MKNKFLILIILILGLVFYFVFNNENKSANTEVQNSEQSNVENTDKENEENKNIEPIKSPSESESDLSYPPLGFYTDSYIFGQNYTMDGKKFTSIFFKKIIWDKSMYFPKEVLDEINKESHVHFEAQAHINPKNNNEIFFSGYIENGLNQKDCKTKNRIYKYDIVAKKLNIIFEIDIDGEYSNEFETCTYYEFISVGIQNDNLILWKKDYSNSPGICFSPFITEGEFSLYSLSLNNPNLGLFKYTPSPELIQHEASIQVQCIKDIE